MKKKRGVKCQHFTQAPHMSIQVSCFFLLLPMSLVVGSAALYPLTSFRNPEALSRCKQQAPSSKLVHYQAIGYIKLP